MLRLISLGGTIACLPEASQSGVAPALSASQMLEVVPQSKALGAIEASNLSNVPSTEITFAILQQVLAELKRVDALGYAGAVITQGTDTIEETAFILSLLHEGDMPVVVTGAMRNASLPGADGPANLLAALRTAADPSSRGKGVMVAFDDMLHAGAWVQKGDTSATGAFTSPFPLGRMIEDRPLYYAALKRPVVSAAFDAAPPFVPILKPGLDDSPRLVEAALAAGAQAIVVELAGGGHVHSNWLDSLQKAAAQVPVIFASRTRSGRVLERTYSQVGGEIDLQNRGLLPSGDLDALKARLLAMVLLMAGRMADFKALSKLDL